MTGTTKTMKRKPTRVKLTAKANPPKETYRALKDSEVILTPIEKKKAELLTKALA
jgi:hypothetical protein